MLVLLLYDNQGLNKAALSYPDFGDDDLSFTATFVHMIG